MGYAILVILLLVGFVFIYSDVSSNRLRKKGYEDWKKLPSIAEYLKKNPDSASDKGVRCHTCKSNSIKNWGLFGPRDDHRIFVCNHCGGQLYRNEEQGP